MMKRLPELTEQLIRQMRIFNSTPKKNSPVIVWFETDRSEKFARMIKILRKKNFQTWTVRITGQKYFLFAETQIIPSPEKIELLCWQMKILAQRHNIYFSGWDILLKVDFEMRNIQ